MKPLRLFGVMAFCVGLLALASDAIAGTIQVGPAKVLLDLKLFTGMQAPSDYHIVIGNPRGIKDPKINLPKNPNISHFPTVATNPPQPIPAGTTSIEINYSGAQFKAEQTIRIGDINFKSEENSVEVTESWFTAGGLKLVDVLIPGMSVRNDPEFTLTNFFALPIGIHNLQFLNNVPELPDPEELDPGNVPGFGLPIPEFILGGGESVTFFVPGEIQNENFLYAQFIAFDPSTGLETVAVLFGHQSVPEPSSFVLLGSGLFFIVFVLFRREHWKLKGGP